jgi:hypothetical protein
MALQVEYPEWLEASPENLHDSPTAQALKAIITLGLDTLSDTNPPEDMDATEKDIISNQKSLLLTTPIREDPKMAITLAEQPSDWGSAASSA